MLGEGEDVSSLMLMRSMSAFEDELRGGEDTLCVLLLLASSKRRAGATLAADVVSIVGVGVL